MEERKIASKQVMGKLELTVIRFSSKDVICTSGLNNINEGNGKVQLPRIPANTF